MSRSKTKTSNIGDITTYVNSNGSLSTAVQTAYDKMVTVSAGGTGITWNVAGGTPATSASTSYTSSSLRLKPESSEAENEAERQERLAEMSASIENLIADFLPDSDKDVPTQIAKAVVDHIFSSGHVLPLLADSAGYKNAESKMLKNFQNMTMEEYAKARPKLMKGITS